MWDLSCPDWQDRIRERRALMPEIPLIASEARIGLRFFDELQLPDVPGTPRLGEAAGDWFRDIVRAAFGSWDPEAERRFIQDIFLLAPKGQSKTSYSAGLMLTAMMMNRRPRAEMLFVGPTQAISDRAYEQAVGMVDLSKDMKRRFKPVDHEKTILDKFNGAELKVKTFALDILTGSIPVLVLLDELHLLGRSPHATKVLRQIRGGLQKRPEGLLLITTTQSDDVPAGAFRDELLMARKIRDGEFRGKAHRPLLPILYEFPPEMAKEPSVFMEPANWSMVMPNMGRSVRLHDLRTDWETERAKGEHAIRVWTSQHLNIEIGIGLHTDRWAGADHWEASVEVVLTLDELKRRCDVITAGLDGGGLDDLLGLCLVGRDRETGRWLVWIRAWAHPIALDRRKSEAARLQDFAKDGDLVIVEEIGEDVRQSVGIVAEIHREGLLGGVGLDTYGIADFEAELTEQGVTGEVYFGDQRAPLVQGIPQGWRMSAAIKTSERGLAAGTISHADQPLMTWCVGNAKVDPRGNAVSITKQAAGTGKIDPLIAMFNAVELMTRDPRPSGKSIFDRAELWEEA